MDEHLGKREHTSLNVLAKTGVVEWLNEKSFNHIGHYGTTFNASRCDFREGVTIVRPKHISEEHFIQDIMEIAAWHAIHIHPRLNGFSGYDCIGVVIKREHV